MSDILIRIYSDILIIGVLQNKEKGLLQLGLVCPSDLIVDLGMLELSYKFQTLHDDSKIVWYNFERVATL